MADDLHSDNGSQDGRGGSRFAATPAEALHCPLDFDAAMSLLQQSIGPSDPGDLPATVEIDILDVIRSAASPLRTEPDFVLAVWNRIAEATDHLDDAETIQVKFTDDPVTPQYVLQGRLFLPFLAAMAVVLIGCQLGRRLCVTMRAPFLGAPGTEQTLRGFLRRHARPTAPQKTISLAALIEWFQHWHNLCTLAGDGGH